MKVATKFNTVVIASSLFTLSIGAAHALTVTFGGGPVTSPTFPGYGSSIEKNNVLNTAGSGVTDPSAAPGGGTMVGTVGSNHAVATVGGAPASGYNVDWYFIGAESGYDVTLNVPSLLGYTEHNQNNQCCGSVQIGPQFIGTTTNLAAETTLNFSLTAMEGATVKSSLANGTSNPVPGQHPSAGSTSASLVFSYASLTSGNPLNTLGAKTWSLSASQVLDAANGIWFLFAFNDTGGPDDNHDDFIGMARVYGQGPDSVPDPTPVPGAVWLFGSVVAGGAGFNAWRKRRRDKVSA